MTSNACSQIFLEDNPGVVLARRAKRIRKAKGMTLSEVEAESRITASTISKIGKGTMSPSDANLIGLSKGLGVDIVELVSEDSNQVPKTRRSITRFGNGPLHSIGTHDCRLLCSDIMSKKM